MIDLRAIRRKPQRRVKKHVCRSVERLEPRWALAATGEDLWTVGYSPTTAPCTCPVCAALPAVDVSDSAPPLVATNSVLSASSATVPPRSSNPAAVAKLFLDFDGRFEATWSGKSNISTPAFDLDGDPSQLNSAELAAIEEIWARVAEDFAPFNLDVTTIDPGHQTDRVVAVIAIGGHYSDWYGWAAAGAALHGGFSNANSNVGYVFSSALGGNPRYVADAVSHEAGHLFGLSHQAVWNGAVLSQGYDMGDADAAPLMGSSYSSTRSVWQQGQTTRGAGDLQDDMAIIAGATNGFGYRPDDFSNTIGAAAPISAIGTAVDFAGIIGRNDDRDVWSFTTSGGNVSLRMAGIGPATNVDAVLELVNSQGTVLAQDAPSDSLDAEWSVTVGPGTYYLVARSSGQYGDVGQYRLTGSLPAAVTHQVLDDGDAGHRLVGSWKRVAGKGYDGDIRTAGKGKGSSISTWTLRGLPAGTYEVWATWSPAKANATNAPYTITSGGKLLKTTRVNQRIAPSGLTADGARWRHLGTVAVSRGSAFVKLTNNANGGVVADAVRFQRVYPAAAPLTDLVPPPSQPYNQSGGEVPSPPAHPSNPDNANHPSPETRLAPALSPRPDPGLRFRLQDFFSSNSRSEAPPSLHDLVFTEQADWSSAFRPGYVDHLLLWTSSASRR